MVDVLVVLRKLVQSGGSVLCRVDGRILWQLQVDQELGTVRRWKELLRNEAHSIERRAEQGERSADRDPAAAHRQREEDAEDADNRRRLLRVRGPRLLEDPNAEQGAKTTATHHDAINAMATTAKIEKVYSPAALRANPMGTNPAIVTSVPASIGKAVEA
jgi:hypothetical protein